MNSDLLGPAARRVEIEVDAIEGWAPGQTALEAMRAELVGWVPRNPEIVVRVDPPIPVADWRQAEESLARVATLVRDHADRHSPRADVTQLHVVYVPTLESVGLAGALGVALMLPHGPHSDDMRMSVLLGTDRIQKIAALWIGPRKVERTVLVHELGHALGLVADGAHQHRGDPSRTIVGVRGDEQRGSRRGACARPPVRSAASAARCAQGEQSSMGWRTLMPSVPLESAQSIAVPSIWRGQSRSSVQG